MYDIEHPSKSTAQRNEFEARLATVLSSPIRKRLLATLHTDGVQEHSELIRLVSTADDDARAHTSTSGNEKLTRTMLYHRDLPKLADYGLIEWERDTGRVTLTIEGTACAVALDL